MVPARSAKKSRPSGAKARAVANWAATAPAVGDWRSSAQPAAVVVVVARVVGAAVVAGAGATVLAGATAVVGGAGAGVVVGVDWARVAGGSSPPQAPRTS